MNQHQGSATIYGRVSEIPLLEFADFQKIMRDLLASQFRLISFFGSQKSKSDEVFLNAVLMKDHEGILQFFRTPLKSGSSYPSFTIDRPEFHCFERECFEEYSLFPKGHPWLKPIRYSNLKSGEIGNYPFFQLKGKEIHEVGVGPVHAGVIEPGHFRFMCFGETVHHLEIQLGYQHRGAKKLLLERDIHQLASLVETLAGDSTIAHTWAFCKAWEALCRQEVNEETNLIRGIALELERVAMHLAGLAGMSIDIGFLPGGSVYGRLRTAIINSSMKLCGSRFGRGWLRPGEVRGKFNAETLEAVLNTIKFLLNDLEEMNDLFLSSKIVQHRLKKVGTLERSTAIQLGFVGMAARSAGVELDLRKYFPETLYRQWPIQAIQEESGDCWARAKLRIREVRESLHWLLAVLQNLRSRIDDLNLNPPRILHRKILNLPQQDSFALACVEGWRGEVLHFIETNSEGKLCEYQVQDPSLRNWFALALAIRNEGISNFPICNKSFDLSYCGHDL